MSTIKANTLLHSDGSQTTEPSIPALDQRMAKAWVNFNGTGTVSIRDSYNVSSITDNGTGMYTINFSTSMANNDYAVFAGGAEGGSVSGANQFGYLGRGDSIWQAGSFQVQARHNNDSAVDNAYMTCVAFGS